MYACVDGGGNWNWEDSKCTPYTPEVKVKLDFENLKVILKNLVIVDSASITCHDFDFKSYDEQADSIMVFLELAKDTLLNEQKLWETYFFCAFPNSYADMDSLFGYHSKGEAGPLYYSHDGGVAYVYGGANSVISFFCNLRSIPDEQFYEKYINICIDGYWQADNIMHAFGFGERLSRFPVPACKALEKRSDEEVKSVFRFIFDSIHPKNEWNERFFNKLLPIVETENHRLAVLLSESYQQLMSENHDH